MESATTTVVASCRWDV